MAKQKRDDIKKEIEEQEKDFYGEGTISGSAPDPSSDDDVDEAVEEVIGNEPEEDKPFSLAEEVEEDEEARRTKSEG